MQNILAFEAADFKLTIALMKDGQVVEEYWSDNLYDQDRDLLPTIDRLLRQHKLGYHQLDLITTTRGPGSFTGIRVALATAKGLSLASAIPAVAFNSFEWVVDSYVLSPLISQSNQKLPILVILESKRQDIYCQLFNEKGQALKEPDALLPSGLAAYVEARKVICIGSGCSKVNVDKNYAFLQMEQYTMPTASSLCEYAKQKVVHHGDYLSLFACEPFYLRLPDVTPSKL